MNCIKQIERLQLLNKLIKEERTGSPEELSGRLGISKRQLFNLIDSMKSLGVELGYCKQSKTYYYKSRARLDIKFSLRRITNDESEKIFGGFSQKRPQCNFISLYENTLGSGLNRF